MARRPSVELSSIVSDPSEEDLAGVSTHDGRRRRDEGGTGAGGAIAAGWEEEKGVDSYTETASILPTKGDWVGVLVDKLLSRVCSLFIFTLGYEIRPVFHVLFIKYVFYLKKSY